MEKRTFIKLTAAAIAAGFTYPFLGCVRDDKKMGDWAGKLTVRTGKLLKASDDREGPEQAAEAQKMKRPGPRHCFQRLADSKDCLPVNRELVGLV